MHAAALGPARAGALWGHGGRTPGWLRWGPGREEGALDAFSGVWLWAPRGWRLQVSARSLHLLWGKERALLLPLALPHHPQFPSLGPCTIPSPDVLTPNPHLSPGPPAPSSVLRSGLFAVASLPSPTPKPRQRRPGDGLPSLLLCPGLSKDRLYPSNPYPFADTVRAEPASPQTPALPRSCLDSVLCRTSIPLPRPPAPRELSSPARSSCFSLLQT